MKDKRKIKFLWKLEDYGFLIRIYYIILTQTNVEANLQFYLYLYLMNK